MKKRGIFDDVVAAIGKGQTILIYGPRQAGKTTLCKEILDNFLGNKKYISADFLNEASWIQTRDRRIYTREIEGLDLLIIDEAQNIPDIGLCLKALHDTFPQCQIIATGSSSFELAQRIQEPLTGRKVVFHLLPLGLPELYGKQERTSFRDHLGSVLVYGLYPAVYTRSSRQQQETIINEISNAYLFKDILSFEGIKKSDTIVKLAKILAFQIGKPVSLNELANKLQISVQTVDRYITVLEQAFIVFRIGSYSKNLRKELSRGQKIYFWDIGVRNALIGQQQVLEERGDLGEIRENFGIAEKLKQHLHTRGFGQFYFWRTYDDQEIDLLYSYNNILFGYEIKRDTNRRYKTPPAFAQQYPHATVQVIDHYNVLERL